MPAGRRTGIPRVVRNVVRFRAEAAARLGVECHPVVFDGQTLRPVAWDPTAEHGPAGSRKRLLHSILSRLLGRRGAARAKEILRPMLRKTTNNLEAVRKPANIDPLSLRERVRVRGLADQSDFPLPRCFPGSPHPGPLPKGEGDFPDGLLEAVADFAPRKRDRPLRATDSHDPLPPPVEFRAGDVLLLLDATFSHPAAWSTYRRAQAAGAKLGVVGYDLIPLRFPQFYAAGMRGDFRKWIEAVLADADFLIGISRASRDDFRAFAQQECPRRWPDEAFELVSPGR